MKNSINLISIIFLSEFDINIYLAIYDELEKYVANYNNLTVKLQNYSHNDEFDEGCLTFSLSRRLEKQEREEFKSDWETDRIMIQFHTQKKLF